MAVLVDLHLDCLLAYTYVCVKEVMDRLDVSHSFTFDHSINSRELCWPYKVMQRFVFFET